MTLLSSAQMVSIAILPLLFGITLHEAAHGWVASKCGDQTARMLGRVTLNPIPHIDLVGTVLFPLLSMMLGGVLFGWAKPVPIAWQLLRHPKRDMILVALAGPFANLLMAFLWAALARLAMPALLHSVSQGQESTLASFCYLVGSFGININCFLMIFNLVPLPPLDGSRVVSSLLPPRMALSYNRIEPYGVWILLGLMMLGVLFNIIQPLIGVLVGSIKALFGLI